MSLRRKRAMLVADGVVAARNPSEEAEARRFAEESRLIREALLSSVREPPPFDHIWAGVEGRLQSRVEEPWWRRVLALRPSLALVPLGVALVTLAVVLLTARPDTPSNACYVDYYEAGDGSVLIEQDPDDPSRPTVIWHLEEG